MEERRPPLAMGGECAVGSLGGNLYADQVLPMKKAREFTVSAFLFLMAVMSARAQQTGPATLENLLEQPGRSRSRQRTQVSPLAERAAVPDQAAVEAAQELVRQVYEEDYKIAKELNNPEPLVQKLLEASSKTTEPTRRYAMLLEAEAVTLAVSNYGRATELLSNRAQQYPIDEAQLRLDLVQKAFSPKAKTDVPLLQELHGLAMESAEMAVEDGNSEAAKSAVGLAVGMAKAMQAVGKSKRDLDVVKAAENYLSAAQELSKSIQKRILFLKNYEESLEVLKTAPDDPKANATVGQYRCFVLGDWGAGLPALAKGEITKLSDIAREDLAVHEGKPIETAAAFSLAGKWWAIADGITSPRHAAAVRGHAAVIYKAVAPELRDPLDKALAAKRSDWLPEVVPEGAYALAGSEVPVNQAGPSLSQLIWKQLDGKFTIETVLVFDNTDITLQRERAAEFVKFFTDRDLTVPLHGYSLRRAACGVDGNFTCFAYDRGTVMAFYVRAKQRTACTATITVSRWMGGPVFLNGTSVGVSKARGDGSQVSLQLELKAGINAVVLLLETGNGGGKRAKLELEGEGVSVGY